MNCAGARLRRWASACGWSLCLLATMPACKRRVPPPPIELAVAASSVTKVDGGRCSPLPGSTGTGFVVGEAAASLGTGSDAGQIGRAAAPAARPDELLPFAAEVGDGVAWSNGFAVGALHAVGGALQYAVVTLDAHGQNGRLVALGPARGEPDPPRVASRDGLLIAGVLEPHINGRSLRLAKIDDHGVTWGATVHEKPGESQAYDLTIGEQKSIVVWDEDGPERSTIELATFDAASVGSLTTARTISARQVDGESPRVLPRRGGFWLSYVARRAAEEDGDARYLAEDIGYRWIETVPLDPNGSPTAPARAISSKDGHVLLFDVAEGPDDGMIVVWRDDDTPSGSAGGAVMRAVVRPASVDAPAVLVDADVGAGAPSLIGGWLAVLDAADTTRMAPVSVLGELRAPLLPEAEIGAGEPIAAGPEGLLVARALGRAVRLSLVRCAAPAMSP